MRPFEGMFQCLWDSSSRSLALNALWQRRLTKEERKECRWWGLFRWLMLRGKKESVQGKKDKSETSALEDYRNSSINKKTLWLLCLKMPKSLSIPYSKSTLLKLLATCLLFHLWIKLHLIVTNNRIFSVTRTQKSCTLMFSNMLHYPVFLIL